ncbi:hypothetical protein [Conexibacter sp. CPCC 206217]|uniref:hypothetical protein n=1 Tax=Conexibacter sp. CPCC 206217 TaxID=3064574 RepID=UPI00271768DF|nr:hypothetical protein [Conexibacter sp. CPCC 206217]MDO8209543.1 hypothetical protein [Conexibacter sp. CPCC 206217]
MALAPAGGWAVGDESFQRTLGHFITMQELLAAAIPHVDAIVASPEGRRRATEFIATNHEHIPAELDGIGHCPQLDVPLEAAQLIAGFTQR